MRRPCSQVLGALAQHVDLYTLLVATIPIATFFVYLKLTTFGPDPKKGSDKTAEYICIELRKWKYVIIQINLQFESYHLSAKFILLLPSKRRQRR